MLYMYVLIIYFSCQLLCIMNFWWVIQVLCTLWGGNISVCVCQQFPWPPCHPVSPCAALNQPRGGEISSTKQLDSQKSLRVRVLQLILLAPRWCQPWYPHIPPAKVWHLKGTMLTTGLPINVSKTKCNIRNQSAMQYADKTSLSSEKGAKSKH